MISHLFNDLMRYKAIIWDADGVLIKSKYLFSERLAKEYGIDTGKMQPFFTGVFRECAIGKADLKKELSNVIDEWGWKGTVDELMEYWFTKGTEFDSDMLAFVKKIHDSRVPSYMATSQEKYRGEHIRHTLEGIYLDSVFISAEIGHTKQQVSFWDFVYDAIRNNTNFTAPITKKEILYIDDGQEEIEAAQQFGFVTYLYDGDFEALRRTLLP